MIVEVEDEIIYLKPENYYEDVLFEEKIGKAFTVKGTYHEIRYKGVFTFRLVEKENARDGHC